MVKDIFEFIIGVAFLLLLYHLSPWGNFGFWQKKKAKGDYDTVSLINHFEQLGSAFDYSSSNIPYGRSLWFIKSDSSLARIAKDIDLLEYYGYSPIKSKKEEDFVEYGILLTQLGLFYKSEDEEISRFYPIAGLKKARLSGDMLKFYYPYRVRSLDLSQLNLDGESLVSALNALVKTGYTRDLRQLKPKDMADKLGGRFIEISEVSRTVSLGVTAGLISRLPDYLKKEKQFNGIASGRQGHGLAAEYANNLMDQIKHPFSKVKQVGQDNLKNGADRIVGHQKIQTKYYSKASGSVNAAFESKADGGMFRYEGMQLEVPKDQYPQAVKLMAKKIEDGKVKGVTNPKDANKIVRKGAITYEESKLIAKGGNLTSLKYDALNGAVQSLPAAGISLIMTYAICRWNGEEPKNAMKSAASTGLTTLAMGTAVFALSQQSGKLLSDALRGKMTATTIASRTSVVISLGLVIGPDLFETLTGRISSQQLLKNSLVAGSGLAGGMATGALMGSTVGLAGTVLGGIIGGVVASGLTKAILDHFIEDDRVEMFAILKEEYIDVVMSMTLTQEEFAKIQEAVFNDKLTEKLKDMYQHKKEGVRYYAREKIVEKVVQAEVSKRPSISDDEIMEAIQTAENEFEVVI